MTYFITKTRQSEILAVLVDYCDAILKKRDKQKQKMEYYDNLMDCVTDLVGVDDTICWENSDRHSAYLALRTKYHEHKAKYEVLKLKYFSIKCNIKLLISYPHIVDSL
jgi:hypothetical protein